MGSALEGHDVGERAAERTASSARSHTAEAAEADGPADGPADGTEALPDLNPWREVGWIFRDGDCVAIARDGGEGASPYILAD